MRDRDGQLWTTGPCIRRDLSGRRGNRRQREEELFHQPDQMLIELSLSGEDRSVIRAEDLPDQALGCRRCEALPGGDRSLRLGVLKIIKHLQGSESIQVMIYHARADTLGRSLRCIDGNFLFRFASVHAFSIQRVSDPRHNRFHIGLVIANLEHAFSPRSNRDRIRACP